MLYKMRRKLLSQNFLYNRTLIKLLVRSSSIGKKDTILEIGPGKGLITSELLARSKKVIAVEIDKKLFLHLQKFLGCNPKLELHQEDFLNFPLPKHPYKVFANLPFSIEGQIVRKLLDSQNPPEESYLMVDSRLANRLSGETQENQFSLKHKPWFDFSIVYKFKRSDFIPEGKVDSVLWKISKKKEPLLPEGERQNWNKFIEIGFGEGEMVDKNLKKTFISSRFQFNIEKCKFSLKRKPGYLSLNEWVKIYQLSWLLKNLA